MSDVPTAEPTSLRAGDTWEVALDDALSAARDGGHA